MAQKFRNVTDLEAVAPSGITSGDERKLTSGRTRHAGFYVPSTPTTVDDELLSSIEATAAPTRRRRAAS